LLKKVFKGAGFTLDDVADQLKQMKKHGRYDVDA